MKNEFDQWLDFDSSSQIMKNNDGIHTPIHQDEQWQNILKPQQKQVLDQSIQIFSSVKRKYQEKFNTKIQNSSSSSPFEDDDFSVVSEHNSMIRSQRQSIMKSQRQQMKRIEEQNRFLKQKVDQLSFRLRQTQIELNKLKYSGNNNIANFESMKQSYLKEINELMDSQKGCSEQTCQVFKKLRELTQFDGKLKVDLLNYFMSQLLQSIINDSTFYYMDSILKKKGLWKQSQTQSLRKVDQQVIQIGELTKPSILRDFKNDLKEALSISGQRYKECWKSFYRSYISLLNQGFVLENFLRLAMGKIFTYVEKQNVGKVQLHFQKIKLRKDIRILRQSWFKEIQYDQENDKKDEKIGIKKNKISYN